jgi:hypothetical protein
VTTTTNITTARRSQAKQWRSYAIMLFASLVVVSSAWLTGCAFNLYYPLPKAAASLLEIVGYILWGTGMAKPKINHLIDCHHTKQLNYRLQVICAEVGIFAFVMAGSLEV